MNGRAYVSLQDFAATFGGAHEGLPPWIHPHAATPSFLEAWGLRHRLEDVLDTVVALQRAERLQDGIYAGPESMSSVYRDVLDAAGSLEVAVPPAILSPIAMRSQGCFGTDGRAYLALSTWFFVPNVEAQRAFMTGRLCGHIAARQVTANTLFSLIADQSGIRQMARRAIGPVLDVVLAPVSLGVRLALSRWHRAAVITCDRAGLLVCRDVEAASMALLRINLGKHPEVDPATYLEQRRVHGNSPGRWTELLASEPWTHKRMRALELFHNSQLYAELTGESGGRGLTTEALNEQTTKLLGVA